MFNVAVIRLRDLVKYSIIIIGIIVTMFISSKVLNKQNLKSIDIRQKTSSNISNYIEKAINLEIPEVEQIKKEEIQEIQEEKEDTKRG